MGRNSSVKTTVLASKGNQSIYATGLALYTSTGRPLVLPGQWVFANPDTGLSTGPAATKATVPNIKIGVGVDLSGDGLSDFIRWSASNIGGCSVKTHNASPANCGLPAIKDFLFGNCIECDKTYSVDVHVRNNETDAFGRHDTGYVYTFSYTYPCGNCSTADCPEIANADVVMCGLYNRIKGINHDPNWNVTLNSYPLAAQYDFPFDVAMLYDTGNTTFEYCFTESDGTCVDCVNFGDIGGLSSTIGGFNVTFNPVTFVTESDVKVSKRAHIESVVEQINKVLDGKGSANVIWATGNCCSTHKLEINSCLTDLLLKDGDGANIATCGNSNPFSAVVNYGECKDCANVNTSTDYTVGLRFFSRAVQGTCDCIPGNNTLAEYFSEIEVYAKGDFAADGRSVTLTRQLPALAEGQGYHWQTTELSSLREFKGEQFVHNNWGGRFGYPKSNDILSHVLTNCRDSYCVISHEFSNLHNETIGGERLYRTGTAHYLIPTGDGTTITSFLATYNAYFPGGDCGIGTATLSCS